MIPVRVILLINGRSCDICQTIPQVYYPHPDLILPPHPPPTMYTILHVYQLSFPSIHAIDDLHYFSLNSTTNRINYLQPSLYFSTSLLFFLNFWGCFLNIHGHNTHPPQFLTLPYPPGSHIKPPYPNPNPNPDTQDLFLTL